MTLWMPSTGIWVPPRIAPLPVKAMRIGTPGSLSGGISSISGTDTQRLGANLPAGAIVYDTFTGTAGTLLDAHTGEVGATWTKNSVFTTGTAGISNANRCRAITAGFSIYNASGAVGLTWTVTTNFFYLGSDASGFTGAFIGTNLQSQSAQTGFWFGFVDANGWSVGRQSLTTITDTSAFTPTVNTNYKIIGQLTPNGGNFNFTMTVNGSGVFNIVNFNSAAFAGAGFGACIGHWSGSDDNTHGMHIDDVLVTA